MKNTTHSNSVTRARPSLKRCSTGIPASSGSWTTNCVAGANTARGLMDHSSSATRSCARPVSARNRTDSGSRRTRIGTSSSGASPPTTNTERQPNCGINAAARKPPRAAPTENPQKMIITRDGTRRDGGEPAPDEHRAPAELRDQRRREKAAEGCPHREPAKHDHHHGGAAATRIELGGHRNRIRHRAPETKPGQNPDRQQHIDILDERRDQRADAERQGREHDDLLAPDAVGKRPEQ